ncbi:MAG: M90 family metallopeptidase [Pseudomonadota bacterium]
MSTLPHVRDMQPSSNPPAKARPASRTTSTPGVLSHLQGWWFALAQRLGQSPKPIPEQLWRQTLADYPFLARLPKQDRLRLRELTGRFLMRKEFTGAHGLLVTDAMAVAIAAQACLPILHMGKNGLKLYDDFKGIVLHPGAMLARRQTTDAAGVVHFYEEVLAGEAMHGGPVTLSWQDVAASGESAVQGHNVVIHEFVHKIDMADGGPNGCPPLASQADRKAWRAVMTPAFDRFRQQIVMAERFGGESPWLDAYGAQSPVEFFAVTAEAYFVNRERFEQDFADLTALFDNFFNPAGL